MLYALQEQYVPSFLLSDSFKSGSRMSVRVMHCARVLLLGAVYLGGGTGRLPGRYYADFANCSG